MKTILVIAQVIDQDPFNVDENFTLMVADLPQSGIDQWKKDFKAFGDMSEDKAIKAGVKKDKIKKHHNKHKKD